MLLTVPAVAAQFTPVAEANCSEVPSFTVAVVGVTVGGGGWTRVTTAVPDPFDDRTEMVTVAEAGMELGAV